MGIYYGEMAVKANEMAAKVRTFCDYVIERGEQNKNIEILYKAATEMRKEVMSYEEYVINLNNVGKEGVPDFKKYNSKLKDQFDNFFKIFNLNQKVFAAQILDEQEYFKFKAGVNGYSTYFDQMNKLFEKETSVKTMKDMNKPCDEGVSDRIFDAVKAAKAHPEQAETTKKLDEMVSEYIKGAWENIEDALQVIRSDYNNSWQYERLENSIKKVRENIKNEEYNYEDLKKDIINVKSHIKAYEEHTENDRIIFGNKETRARKLRTVQALDKYLDAKFPDAVAEIEQENPELAKKGNEVKKANEVKPIEVKPVENVLG